MEMELHRVEIHQLSSEDVHLVLTFFHCRHATPQIGVTLSLSGELMMAWNRLAAAASAQLRHVLEPDVLEKDEGYPEDAG